MRVVNDKVVDNEIEPTINIVKEYVVETGNFFTDDKELTSVEMFALWVVCKHLPLPETDDEKKINALKSVSLCPSPIETKVYDIGIIRRFAANNNIRLEVLINKLFRGEDIAFV